MLRFRSGPQDMPGGWPTAAVLTFAYIAQGLYADRTLGAADGDPSSLVAVSFQFIIVALLLGQRNVRERIPQTLAALAGTGFILGLLVLLILTRVEVGKPQPELALMYLGLFVWSLLVDAHIYRHALSIKMGTGILVSVLIFGANFLLLKSLFG